jgi:hypothetical protein
MRAIFLIVACSLLFAACGGNDSKDKASTSDPTATPAPKAPGKPPSQAAIKQADAACKLTTKKLNRLAPLPEGIDPEDPGDRLNEFAEFLDVTDPNDKIERQLLAKLQKIAPDGGGAYADLVNALSSIITHEVNRNLVGRQGDLKAYQAEYAAADAAYADLRAAADELGAPSCTLGS